MDVARIRFYTWCGLAEARLSRQATIIQEPDTTNFFVANRNITVNFRFDDFHPFWFWRKLGQGATGEHRQAEECIDVRQHAAPLMTG